jgi:hypothetical protein
MRIPIFFKNILEKLHINISYHREPSTSQEARITVAGDNYAPINGVVNAQAPQSIPLADAFKIEISTMGVSINANSRTADGMAISFSLTVPIRIKNLSRDQITIQNLQASLQLPEGYSNSLYYRDLIRNSLDIGGRNHIGGTYLFSAQIAGITPERGTTHGNPVWEANRDRLIANLHAGQIKVKFTGRCVSLNEDISINKEFDLTQEILPKLLSR